MSNNCSLCEREVFTKVLYENEKWWVTECKTCHVPMIVLKEHGRAPTTSEMSIAKRVLEWAAVLYGWYNVEETRFDPYHRTIRDHWHAHLRRRK